MRYLMRGLVLVVAIVGAPSVATAQDAPEFFVVHKGQKIGPYLVGELATRVRMGRLRRDTPVWTDGMTDWQPAAEVPALAKLFDASLPLIPEERDFDAYFLGIWVAEPVQTEIPGMGKGVVTGRTEYRSDGTYAFAGQIDVTDAQGVARTMALSSEGRYMVTKTSLETFEIAFGAPLVMTAESADPAVPDHVERRDVPPGEYKVIDDNTIRDAQGTLSRRRI